ncbi:hypothetical protein [Mucilaginibacter sp. CSA2-8R]|uniref:hypothetical protein n=1 Tax=Mucilaginibacter sp. CSA2-8R TaxID=3141542 RepID=UPI00315DE057
MKRSLISMLLLIAALAACNNRSVKLITGKYVHEGQSEYSIAYDTLIVQTIIPDQIYRVTLKTGFNRIHNKKRSPKEFKVKTWKATWNERTRMLSETDYGRQLLLLPNDQAFQLKASKFTRL